MVFGLFTRKSTLDDAQSSPSSVTKANQDNNNGRLPTPTPSFISATASTRHSPLRFPTALHAVIGGSTTDLTSKDSHLGVDADGGVNVGSPAAFPPETPSPPPTGSTDSKALYELMVNIPAKTLHAYTLAHLQPRTPPPSTSASSPAYAPYPESTTPPPSPDTLTKLTTFFSTLAPPPLLHCARCHADFFEVENEEKDKACRVPHDDESALVERVSGGGYETLWGCCGQTVEGDGGEGPPDGWCYEGRHTTDVKRARFRADSTIHRDKLTSCLKLNCHGVRDQLPRRNPRPSPSRHGRSSPTRKSNPSPTRSRASASVVITSRTRKRPRQSMKEASASEDEQEVESTRGRGRKNKGKDKDKEDAGGKEDEDEGSSMVVDDPPPPPESKPKPKALSRARPPPSTSTTASLSASTSNVNSVPSTKPKSVAKSSSISTSTNQKPKSTAAKPKATSRTLLSQSHTHLASDSDTSSRARPRTRSLVREESRVRDVSRPRATPGRDLPSTRTTSKSTIRESLRARRARKPTQRASQAQTPTSEEELEAEETDEDRDWEEDEKRGRGRKKRRVGA